MNLKNSYIELSNNNSANAQYSKTGKGKYGKMFSFHNTNYRSILAFIDSYHKFKIDVEGKDRSSWGLSNKGQELSKHRTVLMVCSKLFVKNKNIFLSTNKGKVLERINGHDFNEEEK